LLPGGFAKPSVSRCSAIISPKANLGSVDFELFVLGLPRIGAKSFRQVADVFDRHRHVNEPGVTERLIAGYDDLP
jgi:hypothetical protein